MTETRNERTDYIRSIESICTIMNELNSHDVGCLGNPQLIEVQDETLGAISNPDDFPPLSAAIVPGDEVAIALDANLPDSRRALSAVIGELKEAGAGAITVVVGNEMIEAAMERLRDQLSPEVKVLPHHTRQRSSFRYLGPDVHGNPVYLNRWLVDADLVIPIVTRRVDAFGSGRPGDLTGVFPTFADADARRRHHTLKNHPETEQGQESVDLDNDLEAMTGTAEEPAWLLGVQLILMVTPNNQGRIAEIFCGSIEAARKNTLASSEAALCDFVLATIEGESSQQTWLNVARAAEAASYHTKPGGTIVIWSDLGELLEPVEPTSATDIPGNSSDEMSDEEYFPAWDETPVPFERLNTLCEDYQVILRSRLHADSVEKSGLGCLETANELQRLAMALPKRGMLRAAQFQAT